MESGEIFAWLVFMVVITLLFFAAFGQSSLDDQTIEEYMDNLSEDNSEGQR
jgi:hypothetical protein